MRLRRSSLFGNRKLACRSTRGAPPGRFRCRPCQAARRAYAGDGPERQVRCGTGGRLMNERPDLLSAAGGLVRDRNAECPTINQCLIDKLTKKVHALTLRPMKRRPSLAEAARSGKRTVLVRPATTRHHRLGSGIARSIDIDLDNVVSILRLFRLPPSVIRASLDSLRGTRFTNRTEQGLGRKSRTAIRNGPHRPHGK